MYAAEQDFTIIQGKTFQHVLRWGAPPFVYKAITNISQSAPCLITAAGHNIPAGWPVAVVSAKGMKEINAKNNPPAASEYRKATIVDANTVELNDVNSSDYTAYTSGGYLQYQTPVDLTGFTARMAVKDKKGGTELLRLDTDNTRIAIDLDEHTISLLIDATTTAAITWKRGVYDLEMVSSGGVVTPLLTGKVTVIQEVTT